MYGIELIKSLGLTERDIHLFLAAFNGLTVPCEDDPDTLCPKKIHLDWITGEVLSHEMASAAQCAYEDRQRYGRCLDGIENDCDDAPKEYFACSELLAKLTNEEAIALRFFALGWWQGISEAQQQAAA